MIQLHKKILILVLGILITCSCASKKDVLYFSDVNLKEQDTTVFSEGKIQTNDILSVNVSSSSPELAAFYNTSQVAAPSFNGYLVTIEGTITLPILGKISVKGLTLHELENLLIQKLIDGNHLLNPTVSVRLTNAKFTILGEVKNPGTYTFNEQNINLLQALGYAGDLTINGKRQDVLIIREENNKRTYTTINLTSKKWFDSPAYYIKPNDVIYVNPNGPKVSSSGYVPTFTNLLTIVSFAVTTIILLTR
jgi:polysaccharide export outer membrane protein